MSIDSSFVPQESSVPQSFIASASESKPEAWKLWSWSPFAYWCSGLIAIVTTCLAHSLWIRWEGYLGLGVFIGISALMLGLGVILVQRDRNGARSLDKGEGKVRWGWLLLTGIIAVSLIVGCIRLAWQGNALLSLFMFLHLGLFVSGIRQEFVEVWRVPLQWLCWLADGFAGWIGLPGLSVKLSDSRLLAWVVPIVIGGVFLVPLVSSHPDLVQESIGYIQEMADYLFRLISSSSPMEWFLSFSVAVVSMGIMLSVPRKNVLNAVFEPSAVSCKEALYVMARNTLVVVIIVFAIFLSYEWYSLWNRTFPVGFYYAGYAHQGAAWLTIALAMSTVVLSVMFSKSIQSHSKIRSLRWLALIWSVCNLVLAIAVYNRLMIYVNFNGLTRMRIIGFVGVTCVVIGFLLVIRRVVKAKSWHWLIGRQMWAFTICVYALTILPTDWIVHRWNTRCILVDDMAPAVQISVHPISDEGMLSLLPLIRHETEVLQHGVAAMLAERLIEIEPQEKAVNRSWKSYQGSQSMLYSKLEEYREDLQPYLDSDTKRREAITQFKEWAYQWY